MSHRLNHADYTVALIAVLPIEAEAALGILDKQHDGQFESVRGDDYIYIGGEVNGHNVILATWPAGQNHGVGAAAAMVNQVKARFSNIWFSLLVGVAAGLPNLETNDKARYRDIRLGDVLVCVPDKADTGIVHYDLGKDTETRFLLNGRQAETESIVRAAIGNIRITTKRPYRKGNKFAQYLESIQQVDDEDRFRCPSQRTDRLFAGSTQVEREARDEDERTKVWYGSIGSGNSMMRNPERRDELRDKYNVIGLEMEAAGVMNTLPAGVIRGVCDYGDDQKNKDWQPYAAAVAAVYAKGILYTITPRAKGLQHDAEAYNIPFYLNAKAVPEFVGRESEMTDIELALNPDLTSPTRRQVFVAYGPGGIGKTQLALAYAKQHKDRFSAAIWLDGSSASSLTNSFMNVAARMPQTGKGVAGTVAPNNNSIVREVLNWLSLPKNTRWLMVFDNVDRDHQAGIVDEQAYDVEEFFPSADHGSILITTRLTSLVSIGRGRRLDKVADDDALRILEISVKRSLQGIAEVHDTIQNLQGLPLALTLAGSYIRDVGISFAQYNKHYDETWWALMKHQDTYMLREYQGRSMLTTWRMSYEQVKRENNEAANLLGLFSFLANTGISLTLFQPVKHFNVNVEVPPWVQQIAGDSLNFGNAVRLLLRYSLIDATATLNQYSLHPLIHEWSFQELLAQDHEGAKAMCKLVANLVALQIPFDNKQPNYWPTRRLLLPHAAQLYRRIQQCFTGETEEYSGVQVMPVPCAELADLLASLSRLSEAKKMYLRALAVNERTLGAERLSTLNALNNLGNVYRKLGELAEAEKMFLRALTGKEKALGTDHVETLHVGANLGINYSMQGNLAEAEKMFLRALAGTEKAFGAEHVETLHAVHNLGGLYRDHNKLSEAVKFLLRALAGKEKSLGAEHTSVLDTIQNLGVVYQKQGKLAEAEKMYLRALAGYDKALGEQHLSRLDLKNALGSLYTLRGKLGEAEELFKYALAGYENSLGVEHVSTIGVIYNLGWNYRKQGKLAEAEKMCVRALSGYNKNLGPEHRMTRKAARMLAVIEKESGQETNRSNR